jgi:hypothetical protein
METGLVWCAHSNVEFDILDGRDIGILLHDLDGIFLVLAGLHYETRILDSF